MPAGGAKSRLPRRLGSSSPPDAYWQLPCSCMIDPHPQDHLDRRQLRAVRSEDRQVHTQFTVRMTADIRGLTGHLQVADRNTEPHSIAEQRTITDGRTVPVGNGFAANGPLLARFVADGTCGTLATGILPSLSAALRAPSPHHQLAGHAAARGLPSRLDEIQIELYVALLAPESPLVGMDENDVRIASNRLGKLDLPQATSYARLTLAC